MNELNKDFCIKRFLQSLLSASSPPFSLVISVSNYTTVMICSMLCTINFCLTTSRLHSPPVLQQLIQRRLTNNRCLNIMITLFLTLWLSIPSKVTLNALMRMNVMSNICYGLYCHHITSPFNTWKILAPFVVQHPQRREREWVWVQRASGSSLGRGPGHPDPGLCLLPPRPSRQ